MTQQEAEVIARLARSQVGATAQVQREGETWVVLARLGDRVERIANGAEYTAWRARALPAADEPKPRRGRARSALGVLGSMLVGVIGIAAQAVGAVFGRSRSTPGTEGAITSLLEERERGYGYRQTHPPGKR